MLMEWIGLGIVSLIYFITGIWFFGKVLKDHYLITRLMALIICWTVPAFYLWAIIF